jgi:hypothetical protein
MDSDSTLYSHHFSEGENMVGFGLDFRGEELKE